MCILLSHQVPNCEDYWLLIAINLKLHILSLICQYLIGASRLVLERHCLCRHFGGSIYQDDSSPFDLWVMSLWVMKRILYFRLPLISSSDILGLFLLELLVSHMYIPSNAWRGCAS